MAIWSILCPFGIFSCLWVYFLAFGYIFLLFGIFSPRFGMLNQDKSGNSGFKWAATGADAILNILPS
jgi:hypothetical protein